MTGKFEEDLASLSPEQRELLEALLDDEGVGEADAGQGAGSGEIPRRDDPGTAPLSFPQERLWSLGEMAGDVPWGQLPLAFRLRGELRAGVLADALTEVVARHEVLRTRFPRENGRPRQVIDPPAEVELPVVSVEGSPGASRLAAALERAEAEACDRFDLTREAPLRVRLYRLGADDHLFLLVTHHLATDGWGGRILLDEVSRLYRAAVDGRPADLPPVDVQYGDFAAWQRDHLPAKELGEAVETWRELASGLPEGLELPLGRSRSGSRSFRGGREHFRLSRKSSDGLRELCREEAVTPFLALLAVYQATFHRHTGQEEVWVTTPVSSRERPETERLVGNFSNNLMIRGNLSGRPSFRELLARTRETALTSFRYQHLPMEKILEEIARKGGPGSGRVPEARAGFVMRDTGVADVLELPGLDVTAVPVEVETAPLDLALDLEAADRIGGHLEYSSDLYDADAARRLIGHFRTLLASAVERPGRPLAELSLLPEEERKRIRAWSCPEREVSLPASPLEPWRRHLETRPDAPAVLGSDGEVWSRREVDRQVRDAVPREKGDAGTSSERRTGSDVPGSPEAGGLDPTSLIEDSPDRTVVRLLAGWEAGRECRFPPMALSGGTEEDVIRVPVASLAQSGRALADAAGLEAGDRLAVLAPPGSEPWLAGLLAALDAGAALWVPEEPTLSPMGLRSRLRSLAITAALVPASRLGWLVGGEFPELERLLVPAGEPTPVPTEAWRAGRRVVSFYGLAEAGLCALVKEWDDGTAPPPEALGRPAAGVRAHVLDANGQPVPMEAAGELSLEGAGMAVGMNVPFRTGERVRLDPDGRAVRTAPPTVWVRIDGRRVHVPSVERTLADLPAVEDVAVVVRDRPRAGRALAAYVVPDRGPEGRGATSTELRARLRRTLLPEAVPVFFIFLEAIPREEDGTLDWTSELLPHPFRKAGGLSGARTEPRTPAEKLVHRLCSALLDRDEVDMRRNFFDLGGTSLLALQFLVRLEEETGVYLSPAVLGGGTLSQVAAACAEGRVVGAGEVG